MSFEDDFRTSLQSQAGDLDLHGRGATEVMHLARRRQHRARRAGAVAAVGVLGVGAVGIISVRGRDDDGVAITSWAAETGLADIGPLELSWQPAAGGITGGVQGEPTFTEDVTGAVYALSTAPGSRYDPMTGEAPQGALYRLADDGTWQPMSVGAAQTPLVDVVADHMVLYAVGTSPGTGAVGYDTVLSSSADGGATWTTVAKSPVAPPSHAVAWLASSTLSIERVPGGTTAVVSTSFSPPQSYIDEALVELGLDPQGLPYGWQYTDAGVAIVDYSSGIDEASEQRSKAEGLSTDPAAAVPTTVPPTAVEAEPPGTAPDPQTVGTPLPKEPTVVAVVPWADLGVTGPADLAARTEVLALEAGAWVPVAAPALAGISVSRLASAGQDLILEGWAVGDLATGAGRMRTFASADGRSWREIATLTSESRLFGLGNAWVDVPWGGGDGGPVTVRSSGDGGASWQTLDLATVDPRLAGAAVLSVSSGPLGLAAVAMDVNGQASGPSYLVTTRDLVNWTVTPLAEVTGGPTASPSVFVGSDRIVVTATEGDTGDGSALPASVTAIGTPVR